MLPDHRRSFAIIAFHLNVSLFIVIRAIKASKRLVYCLSMLLYSGYFILAIRVLKVLDVLCSPSFIFNLRLRDGALFFFLLGFPLSVYRA